MFGKCSCCNAGFNTNLSVWKLVPLVCLLYNSRDLNKVKFFIRVRIITFGTFDIFHVGHLNLLQRAADKGHHLTVGVSSDKLNFSKKQRFPICSENSRKDIIQALNTQKSNAWLCFQETN